jgi:Lar family restriction alleviation protein
MDNIEKIERPAAGGNLELLPCPFCGSDDIVFVQYAHTIGPRWRIFCCGCSAGVDPGWAEQKSIVRDLWNTRK